MSPVLELSARQRLGDFEIDAELVSEGRLTALLGRSGSGKTSLINIVAGLARPRSGHVRVDGQVLLDTARGIDLPSHRRRIGYVFQEARLFPHLTVRQNLLFGRWFAPRGEEGGIRLDAVLDLLGIGHLLARRPAKLSGGEKQRVAIGRALLSRPRLLLMDEPLAALDQARKDEILPYIERLRDEVGIPIVYVSHSLAEVARLATTVALVDGGRIVACGATRDILARRDLPGEGGRAEPSAVIEAEITGREDQYGLAIAQSRAGTLSLARGDLAIGRRLKLRVAASDVMISLAPPQGISALNVLAGRIAAIVDAGPVVELQLDCNGEILPARITAKSRAALGLSVGMTVHAVIKSVSVATP